ncbi:hypothetical protein I7105_005044 [Vibrio parahaemolyticus]|nr:hypothetical protein [Salmonella enterica]EGQ8186722.1 hypothetical protein [Vibrio parahaemolyticus]
MSIIAVAILVIVGVWLGRRLAPALVGALFVVFAPFWLVLGFVWDMLRKLPAGLQRLSLAVARVVGFLVVLPLTPFIFVWAFLAELFRPSEPPAPVKQATRRTADVIDLATARKKYQKRP